MIRISLLMLIGIVVVSCQMPTNQLPSLPLVLVPGIGRTEVRWEPISGADHYRVVWTSGSPTLVGGRLETNTGFATADGLLPGVDYTVTVTALSGDQPLALASRPWRSEGWTWVADPVVLASTVTQDSHAFDLGDGNVVIFISTTSVVTERRERLNYTAGGLTRTTWLRVTTKAVEVDPTVVDKEETTVAGVWVQPWLEFSAGRTERTTFTSNRSTFTLASAPGVVWHQSR